MPTRIKTAYSTLRQDYKVNTVVFDDTPMKREIDRAAFHRTFYERNVTIHIIADFHMSHEMATALKNKIISGEMKTYHFPSYAYIAPEKKTEPEDKKLPIGLVQQRFG